MKCLFINLERRPDRLHYVQNELSKAKLDFERVTAVDCLELTADEMVRWYDEKAAIERERKLSAGEIACALSHMTCWKKIIDDNLPYAIVFEDDVVLTEQANSVFDQIENLALNAMLSSKSVILFSHTKYYKKSNAICELNSTSTLYKSYGCPLWGYAYFITNHAAKALLDDIKKKKIYFPIDNWWEWGDEGIIDLQSVIPFCAMHNTSSDSNLELDRKELFVKKENLTLGNRLKFALSRLVFQLIGRHIHGIKTQRYPF